MESEKGVRMSIVSCVGVYACLYMCVYVGVFVSACLCLCVYLYVCVRT